MRRKITLVFLIILFARSVNALTCVNSKLEGYSVLFERSLKAKYYDDGHIAYPLLKYAVLKSKTEKGDEGLPFTDIQKVEYFAPGFSLTVDFTKKTKWKNYRNDGKSESLIENPELAYEGVLKVKGRRSVVYCRD